MLCMQQRAKESIDLALIWVRGSQLLIATISDALRTCFSEYEGLKKGKCREFFQVTALEGNDSETDQAEPGKITCFFDRHC